MVMHQQLTSSISAVQESIKHTQAGFLAALTSILHQQIIMDQIQSKENLLLICSVQGKEPPPDIKAQWCQLESTLNNHHIASLHTMSSLGPHKAIASANSNTCHQPAPGHVPGHMSYAAAVSSPPPSPSPKTGIWQLPTWRQHVSFCPLWATAACSAPLPVP